MPSSLIAALVDASQWTSADWIGLAIGAAGLLVSIGGFWIAINQIRKTRTAAHAAASAADRTARALVQNHLLFLIPELTRLVAETETAVSTQNADRAAELMTHWRSSASRTRGLLRARGDLPRPLAAAFNSAFAAVTESKAQLRQDGANVTDASEPALRAIDRVMDEITDLGGQFLGDPQGH